MFARHFIDSLDFAHKGQELRGTAPVSGMTRLQDVLAAPDGEISYVLRGLTGKDGKPLLELALEGECQLRCQRCLQGMPYAIKTVSLLMPVPEIELEGSSPEGGELEEEDGIDRIPADAHLDVLGLVEDEILLGLPFSPRHESGACAAAAKEAGNVSAGKPNPFAVLRELKDK